MARKRKKSGLGDRWDGLKKSPIWTTFSDLRRALRSRRKVLDEDKVYQLEKERISSRLNQQIETYPDDVREFFRRFMSPDGRRLQQIRSYIRKLKDPGLQRDLRHYVEFSFRFKVIFQPKAKAPHFKEIIIPPSGSKFHAKLVKGKLEPAGPVVNDENYGIPFDEFFESDELKVPGKLQTLIDFGTAQYVLVEDKSGTSALNVLERISYDPDRITFVRHIAEQPYLLCLIGEKVSKKLFDMAGPVVTEFQREYYCRGKAGRPPDLAKRKQAIKLIRGKGPMKMKAGILSTGESATELFSNQSYLSRLNKKIK
jgi:hypothetical protein